MLSPILLLLLLLLLLRRSQWPRGLKRGSTAARLLGSWVWIPPGAWMSVCCECCVLSGRCLCDGLITRPEESYRLWCVSNVCDHETSTKRGGPGPYRAVEPNKKKIIFTVVKVHISKMLWKANIDSLELYRAYTKEWCGFKIIRYWYRTILLCMPCI
jgi:hypothetical protein